MKIFNLPDLGEGLADAEIREWYIKAGDTVKKDQPIVSMETAKAVVDVPSPRDGTIAKLHGDAGSIIDTGAALVEFTDGDEETSNTDNKAATVVGAIEVGDTVIQESATGVNPSSRSGNTTKALPAARALAKKLGVNLDTVSGTGPNGLITVKDIENSGGPSTSTVASGKAAAPEGYEGLRGVRRTMATAMSASHAEVVPVTIHDDVDISHWEKGTDISLRLIKALIAGCQAEPSLNAWYDGKSNSRKLFDTVNLGIALDSAEGLFVPVIKDIQNISDDDIRSTINRFKTEVADRSIAPDELQGNTITLSNFGVFAGRYASPIITPPTVAILGVGRIYNIGEQRFIPFSLTFDHRAATGGEATRFLAQVMEKLQ